MLARCPRGTLAELDVYLYGDVESGFAYEHRRNSDFCEDKKTGGAGCAQRGKSSVFRYQDSDTIRASGNRAPCSLFAFVDDHIAFGHPKGRQTPYRQSGAEN